MTRLRSWFRNVLRRSSVDVSLDEELRACLDILIAQKVERGAAPAEARREALLEIGGAEIVKERVRDLRIGGSLGPFLYDTRSAFRLMRRNPLLAGTSTLLIALTVGLACTVFAVLDAVVLRRLPVPNPERLVLVKAVEPNSPTGLTHLTRALFDDLQRRPHGASHLFGWSGLLLPLTIDDVLRPGRIFGVTGDYFVALDARPAVGRLFDADEQDMIAVISHELWRTEYGSDPAVVGRTLHLGTTPVTIVGVTEPRFVGTQPDSPWDAIMPHVAFHQARGFPEQAMTGRVETAARLPHGTTADAFATSLNALWPSILEATAPSSLSIDDWREQRGSRVDVQSLATGMSYLKSLEPNLARAIGMTFSLTLLVWCATCVTIALLAVARGVKQQSRIAIMFAVGGSRFRVLRPYAIESLVIAVAGCALGLALAVWLVKLGVWFTPGGWRIAIDQTAAAVGVIMAGLAAAVGAMFGAALALRIPVQAALRQDMRVSRPHLQLRTWLLSVQFAVSVVLLSYALLYVDVLSELTRVPLGFDERNLQIHHLSGTLPSQPLDRDYFQRLQDRVRQIPGVDLMGMTAGAPPAGYLADASRPVSTDGPHEDRADTRCAFPGFFDILHAPLHAGRDLAWDDGPAAVVTARLASRLFPDGQPLGRTIRTSDDRSWQIVGVVGDMAYNGQRLGARSALFVPCLEQYKPWPSSFSVAIMIRSSRSTDDVKRDVQSVIQSLGAHYLYASEYQTDVLARSLKQEQLLATVSGTSGSLVVILTGIGLYGFCAYVFAFRRRELAIRSALGATPGQIGTSIVFETFQVLMLGTILGVAGTFGLQQVLAGVVVGLPEPTVWGLGLAVLGMATVVAIAVAVPARSATRLNVANVLRMG